MGPRTGLLIRVHASNYRIEGFTEAVDDRALAELGARHGVPFVTNLGSRSIVDLGRFGLPSEPVTRYAPAPVS
jgi:L-seryl-tRNA(Ser) seleniumtransferase